LATKTVPQLSQLAGEEKRASVVRGGFAGHMAASPRAYFPDTAAMAPYWVVAAGYRAPLQPFDSIGPGTAPLRRHAPAHRWPCQRHLQAHMPWTAGKGRRKHTAQLDPRRIKKKEKSPVGWKRRVRKKTPGRPTTPSARPLASPLLYYHFRHPCGQGRHAGDRSMLGAGSRVPRARIEHASRRRGLSRAAAAALHCAAHHHRAR